MATQILALHWKAVRLGLIPFIVGAFALPLLSVQGMGGDIEAARAVSMYQVWLPLYPMLAAALGITLALSAWNWDHQQGHVYALSLPVARWEYALLKLGAGVVLTLLPVAAFLAGTLLATWSVSLPQGLNAYPVALTLRFMFALASGTIRTTVVVLSVVFGAPLLLELGLGFLGNFYPGLQGASPTEWIFRKLVELPGPFSVFTGSWMLIDV